jgi:hypothetical protein
MKHFVKKNFDQSRSIKKLQIDKFRKNMKLSTKNKKKMIKKSWIPGDEEKVKLSWEIKKF